MPASLEAPVFRTPNPDCPACQRKRLHSAKEVQEFHPYSGHGFAPELGWTHPDLGPAKTTDHKSDPPAEQK